APDQTAEVVKQLSARKTVLARDSGFADDDFSTVRVKTLLIATRAVDPAVADRLEYFREIISHDFLVIRVELDDPDSRESLRNALYRELALIRVYTKKPGRPAELEHPY